MNSNIDYYYSFARKKKSIKPLSDFVVTALVGNTVKIKNSNPIAYVKNVNIALPPLCCKVLIVSVQLEAMDMTHKTKNPRPRKPASR